MNAKNLILFFFLLLIGISYGQKKKTNGDVLFFEYDYKGAIREYVKEMRNDVLSNEQYTNLAEAYFKVNNFEASATTYKELFQKDVELAPYQINKMLQAMNLTVGVDSTQAFFTSNDIQFSEILKENAQFNIDLLSPGGTPTAEVNIFNANVNSPESDFAPSFYRDKLLFTSAMNTKSTQRNTPKASSSFLNIYQSEVMADGDLNSAQPFSGIPFFEYHQGTPYYSEALDIVFYIRSNDQAGELVYDENGKNTLALGSADRKGTFRLLLKDLSTSFYYPFYDAASGKLYFAANFEDSLGGTDIYYVYTNNGLIMSSPINLGPRINTPGNEIAPYIFEGSLYFASDVFYGLGGMDTYKSEILEDNIYSIPVNLGKGLNSEEDDFGFIINNYQDNSLIGYFSSNRPGGKGSDDIYGFIIKDKPGIKTFTLNGSVLNITTNDKIPDAEVRLLDEEGNVIKQVVTNSEGIYRIEVPWRENITVQATKGRHSIFSNGYTGEALEQLQTMAFNIGIARVDDLVEETEEQTVLKINKFYFDKGQSKITEAIAIELEKVVDAVSRFPQMQLRIESHTDSRGGGATNFKLSQSRADAIKEYLETHGVSTSNILYSIGYGEDKLLNDCTDGVFCLETFHKKNERQLIVVLNYDLLF